MPPISYTCIGNIRRWLRPDDADKIYKVKVVFDAQVITLSPTFPPLLSNHISHLTSLLYIHYIYTCLHTEKLVILSW